MILTKPGTYTIGCVYSFNARAISNSQQFFKVAGATPKVSLTVE